ncbi:hypothetical protein Ccrd_015788 [Cynara cardunculus var. scolymus]|uniref:Hydroxyproline-rich glycoprotein family protein n=2 Tax=Cynara cardunculus var. scolymus TaxID=59895 RepID=A0A103YB98_CYNCS|nr:hypothetical protein Ccrd_015788 [Cynara cardunculus var. scolymus]
MVFIIPSLIQSSYHIFKPNSVKKSWDSINLILVLIALAFGFLGRNINNDDKLSFDNEFDRSSEPELSTGAPIMTTESSTHRQWYDFRDQPVNSVIGLRRQRTSSSYPDLRELSPPKNHRATGNRRFSDDTHLDYYRGLESNRNYLRQRSRIEHYGDSFSYTPPLQPPNPEEGLHFPLPELPSLPPQPPPPPQTAAVKKKTKIIYQNAGGEDREGRRSLVTGKIWSPGNEPSEYNGGRGERKRGDGERRRARSSEPRKILSPVIDPVPEPSSPLAFSPLTKGFFTSFYHKKKKKRQRDRSVDNLYSLLHNSQPAPVRFYQPPPPPPPPPPSILHNSFPSKKEKQKRVTTVTRAPPAPPPPPRTKIRPPPSTVTRVAPFTTDKPRAPLTMSSFTAIDDSSSGGDSPMKNIPPPPPLPPFKMPDWKFAVEGDFVRLQSTLSSRSVSPDGDEAHSPSSDVEEAAMAVAPPHES